MLPRSRRRGAAEAYHSRASTEVTTPTIRGGRSCRTGRFEAQRHWSTIRGSGVKDGVPDGQVTGFRRPEAPAPPRPPLSRREIEPGFGWRLGLPMPPTGTRPEKRVVQRTPNLGTFTGRVHKRGLPIGSSDKHRKHLLTRSCRPIEQHRWAKTGKAARWRLSLVGAT